MKKGMPSPTSAMPNKQLGQSKEIVSAMVRLNNQGLNVPVKFEELKKLPLIPNTSTMKKKVFTDMLPQQNYLSLNN